MSSSKSRTSTRSPISEVPYDILKEIFLHCLPRYPLETWQPDPTVAPMLLCQICSSWRAVAFVTPSLWSHFSYRITARWNGYNWRFCVLHQEDIDFILWWKRNQGSIAPFLRLEIEEGSFDCELSPVENGLAILLQYVTSAQYLQVESPFWYWLKSKLNTGDEVAFLNLHTLVTHRLYIIPELARTVTLPFLRRLTVYGDILEHIGIIPKNWSALTHLAIGKLYMYLDFWFSLIQAIPDLQWAYIDIGAISGDRKHTESPAKYVLPQLSTLFMACYARERDNGLMVPFSLLLSPLYLPTLRTLSLSSRAWEDHRAISDLYTVLQSTPAVTMLALRGPQFLCQIDYPKSLATIADVEPIWGHVPHLTHLQLDLPDVDGSSDSDMAKELDTFVHNILSNPSWLSLELPGCPIEKVTLVDIMPSNPDFDKIRNFTMSSIRKHAGGMLNISFKVISESEDDTGEGVWKEWGSKNC